MNGSLRPKQMVLRHLAPQMEVPFSLAEYAERLDCVRQAMAEAEIDLLYLSAPESMFYLSGYQSEWYQAQSPKEWVPLSGIAVHVDHDKMILFDTEEEAALARCCSIVSDMRLTHGFGPLLERIVGDLEAEGWLGGTVGLEMGSYRPNRLVSERFQAGLEGAGCQVVDGTDIVRTLRGVKSPQEMAYMETAARIAEIGMQAAMEVLEPGVTELDVWAELTYAMARAGGELPGIPLPVASGAKSACPHALASRRQIMPGDVVIVDICGVYNRYHVNMARTFSVGEPHPDVTRMVELSAGSAAVLEEVLRPNLPVAELNARVKTYYQEAGIWEDRWWVGGYELGIAFPPDWVGAFTYDPDVDAGEQRFVPGMVVNYESNFYLPHGAGSSMLIHSFAFKEDEAVIMDEFPSELIVIE